MARGINKKGSVVGPRLAFTTRDKQATAVIGLGKDAPEATLTVAWYRLAGIDRREHLFSQEIRVGPGALAYSQGVAGGGLAPGLYETVATLGERQVRTPWIVRRRGSAEKVSAPASDSAASVLVSSRSAQRTPSWDLPSPGESGVWEDEAGPAAGGSPPARCTVTEVTSGFRPATEVRVRADLSGPCSTLVLTATVSGPPTRIGMDDALSGPFARVFGQADVCALSGGSDLPGTVVHFEATGSASAREDFVLEDLGVVAAAVEALPAAGSKVAAGQRIKLHAIAFQFPPAQGIKVLYVDDGTDLIESVGNKAGSTGPVSCNYGRLVAELDAEYQVPADPPPVIEICANAEDFAGVRADAEDIDGVQRCIEFYTGEVWEGLITGRQNQAGCSPASSEVTGDLKIVVGNDGTVAGSATVKRGAFSCGGSEVPAFDQAYRISGRKTAAAFELMAGGDSLTMPISGTQASTTFMHGSGGYSETVTYTLDCVSCQEPAG